MVKGSGSSVSPASPESGPFPQPTRPCERTHSKTVPTTFSLHRHSCAGEGAARGGARSMCSETVDLCVAPAGASLFVSYPGGQANGKADRIPLPCPSRPQKPGPSERSILNHFVGLTLKTQDFCVLAACTVGHSLLPLPLPLWCLSALPVTLHAAFCPVLPLPLPFLSPQSPLPHLTMVRSESFKVALTGVAQAV